MLKRWKSGENKRLLKRKRQTESTTSEITSVKLPTWKSTKVGITQRSQQPKQKAFAAKKKKQEEKDAKEERKGQIQQKTWERDYGRKEGIKYAKIWMRIPPILRRPRHGQCRKEMKLCEKRLKKKNKKKTFFSHFIQSMDKINSSKERHNKISQRNERIYNTLELSRQTFQEELTMLKEPLKGQMTCIICI